MNKLNVGDYVRTKYGIIAKITDIIEDLSIDCDKDVYYEDSLKDNMPMMEIPYNLKDEYIIKSSPQIIDLIEVGDFITYKQGNFYWGIPEIVSGRYNRENQLTQLIVDEKPLNTVEILTVVTHEQFENISYKVGEW